MMTCTESFFSKLKKKKSPRVVGLEDEKVAKAAGCGESQSTVLGVNGDSVQST